MSTRFRVVLAIGLLAAVVTAAFTAHAASTGTPRTAPTTLDPRKEARFEHGEAGRRGPTSPAAEQVEDRAFPLGYVDDRRAAVSRKAYEKKGTQPDRPAFSTATALKQAPAAPPRPSTAP